MKRRILGYLDTSFPSLFLWMKSETWIKHTATPTLQAASEYESYTLLNVTYLARQLLPTTRIGAFKFLPFMRFNVRIKAPFNIVISRKQEKRPTDPKLIIQVPCKTHFINSFHEKVSKQINQLRGTLHQYLSQTDKS